MSWLYNNLDGMVEIVKTKPVQNCGCLCLLCPPLALWLSLSRWGFLWQGSLTGLGLPFLLSLPFLDPPLVESPFGFLLGPFLALAVAFGFLPFPFPFGLALPPPAGLILRSLIICLHAAVCGAHIKDPFVLPANIL